jgi:hypothetical protein
MACLTASLFGESRFNKLSFSIRPKALSKLELEPLPSDGQVLDTPL